MEGLPQVLARRRAARVRLPTPTPAVLRYQEACRVPSNLQVISKFVAPDQKNRRNLDLGIQSHLYQDSAEERWIAKYRSALLHNPPPQSRALKIVLSSVAFGVLVVVGVVYVFHFGLLR